MKIVFSRKGFDSGYGGCASPILDGQLVPLPIPEQHAAITFAEVEHDSRIGQLVEDLSPRRRLTRTPSVRRTDRAHLDPDLWKKPAVGPSWRPLFGQSDSALGHLRNQEIDSGDLFLFYGWFRDAAVDGGRYVFRQDGRNLHVFFGWLEVERVLKPHEYVLLSGWASEHPHLAHQFGPPDAIYVGRLSGRFGCGVFRRFDPQLVLTDEGVTRRFWRLPRWFHPDGRESHLTYHGDLQRWALHEETVRLATTSPAQEFVLNCEDYPEAEGWVAELLTIGERLEDAGA